MLQNVRIVLARAERQVSALKADLERRGAQIIELPALEIEDLKGWETQICTGSPPAWTIVCGRGSAERLARLIRKGQAQPELLGRIAAVGESTSKYLEKNGLWAQRTCASDAHATLIATIGEEALRGAKVRLIAPENSPIAQSLRAALHNLDATPEIIEAYRVHLYDGPADVFDNHAQTPPDLVVFPSLKTITHFGALLQECGAQAWANLPAAAIGATTSKAASEHGYRVVAVPEMNTMQALAEAIERWHTVH